MLKRETQLRNAAETQKQLDDLNPEHQDDEPADGDEKQPETMDEAKEMIAALRAQLEAVATVIAKPHSAPQEKQSLREAAATPTCDKEVFQSIKARVVREFGLGPEYVDVLNSAVSRFPGDADIVASANYLRYNRAVQGTLEVGDIVPMDDIALVSLDGSVGSMRELLTTPQLNCSPEEELLPIAIVAGSIT